MLVLHLCTCFLRGRSVWLDLSNLQYTFFLLWQYWQYHTAYVRWLNVTLTVRSKWRRHTHFSAVSFGVDISIYRDVSPAIKISVYWPVWIAIPYPWTIGARYFLMYLMVLHWPTRWVFFGIYLSQYILPVPIGYNSFSLHLWGGLIKCTCNNWFFLDQWDDLIKCTFHNCFFLDQWGAWLDRMYLFLEQ